jgi:moderate conductance mechanosensitive channel
MSPLQTLLFGYASVILIILLLMVVAFLITINASRIAGWLVGVNGLLPGRHMLSDQRRQTLVRLYASLVSVVALLIVIIGTMRIFVDPSQIIWIIGLFSAGFGLGARVLVSDLIAGGTYIFRNTFTIGEKAEFIVGGTRIEGIVEDVNMRSTLVRAPTGELYTVPNG